MRERKFRMKSNRMGQKQINNERIQASNSRKYLKNLDRFIEIIKQDNENLKLKLKRQYEKEQSEIKMKFEIDRVQFLFKFQVRQDLISVRNQEVEKLNELYKCKQIS
ncbi:unnamed protein product [Paramecium pentaurelia]|uniref:Uncharacterized protein n=1 Tax=Paramecium pentaurelia TaxID=43138 RepID=A0A8S1VSH3_9CILI|nr:unnamed protein product [Paramecium pentaurelia]